jgi:hypothetical protein
VPQLQLPLEKLTKLQALQLTDFHVQLPHGHNHGSSAAVSMSSTSAGSDRAAQYTLPCLQQLTLTDISFVSVSSLLQLTNAPQLTGLQLQEISFRGLGYECAAGSRGHAQAAAAATAVLQLPGVPLTDAAVQQLSAMQPLQQFELEHMGDVPVCDLQHLPSSITQLKLTDVPSRNRLSLPPQLPQLSRLQQLHLEECTVPTKVLGCFTQLRVLCLQECTLLPRSQPEDDSNTEGTAALLEVLASLTLLQDLACNCLLLDTYCVAPQHFSALTASDHQTRLTVRDQSEVVPEGAVQYMFAPGRQMQLQHLCISTYDLIGDIQGCLSAADMECIISCCPCLQSLDICNSVETGADLSTLLQLPQTCTSLCAGGEAFADDTAPFLVQLTQLRSLTWMESPGLTEAGLRQLVGLDLDSLFVQESGIFCSTTDCQREMNLKTDPELVRAAPATWDGVQCLDPEGSAAHA